MDHTAETHSFVRDQPGAGGLPGGQYGELVGAFDHATTVPGGSSRPDDNHIYLWVRIADGRPLAGSYECGVNVRSRDNSAVQYTELHEDLGGKPLPEPGFAPATLSYPALKVSAADFRAIQDGELQALVLHYAQTCTRVAALGVTYPEGTGLHDIHMNSGEPPGGAHPDRANQDGALVFYFAGNPQDNTPPSARWLLIKFATQAL